MIITKTSYVSMCINKNNDNNNTGNTDNNHNNNNNNNNNYNNNNLFRCCLKEGKCIRLQFRLQPLHKII